jgi:hypothetical protein
MLSRETWEEIYVQKGINEVYNQFLNKFLDYFNKVFPLKSTIKRDVKSNTCISKGIKVSSQKMRFLNNLNQRIALSTETLNYINRYQGIYKRVILGSKKRHNNKCIENASNPNKITWQIINKEIGKLGKKGQEIWLQSDARRITHPQKVADTLNSYSIDKVEELVEKSKSKDKVISLKK